MTQECGATQMADEALDHLRDQATMERLTSEEEYAFLEELTGNIKSRMATLQEQMAEG